MSQLLKLNSNDALKGIVIAVLGAFLAALQQSLNGHGLDVLSYDWAGIIDFSVKAAGVYLLKNFISDKDGKVLGRI